jgi:hypothetical protein
MPVVRAIICKSSPAMTSPTARTERIMRILPNQLTDRFISLRIIR